MTTSLDVLAERVENLRETMLHLFSEAKNEALLNRNAITDVAAKVALSNGSVASVTQKAIELKRESDYHLVDANARQELLELTERKLSDHLAAHSRDEFTAAGRASAFSSADKWLLRIITMWSAVAGGAVALQKLGLI